MKIEDKMIREIKKLKETTLNRVMVPRVDMVTIPATSTVSNLIKTFTRHRFSRYPVHWRNEGNIIGIVYIKDILPFWQAHADLPVVEFIRLPCFFYEAKTVLDCFLELQSAKISMAIVIDEFGGTVGMVTIEDLLEEVFGEIYDEYEIAREPYVIPVGEKAFIVEGRIAIEDFSEKTGIEIPAGEVNTIAGFVTLVADCIPKTGDLVTYKDLEFQIIAASKKRVERILVKKV
ncbi:MAG TPA: CBS domain-containing protein [bacterium (Candidatus Stahlbacteria)]|nr:CBS domain-containing protein [Candidatus Stahlbacteria bacterium]